MKKFLKNNQKTLVKNSDTFINLTNNKILHYPFALRK